jgi:hypothetical protein
MSLDQAPAGWSGDKAYASSERIGDDTAGGFQKKELQRDSVEAHWIVAAGHSSQASYVSGG